MFVVLSSASTGEVVPSAFEDALGLTPAKADEAVRAWLAAD
ncbi:MAG: hypothetical protein ACOZNI_36795 [Myxococcota bacterium]